MRKLLVGAAAAALLSLPGQAAELVAVEGDVKINRGSGFVKAELGQEVKVGDRIMIGSAGGSAKLAYGPNCTMDITTGRVFVVLPQDCRKPSFDGRMNQGAGGAGGAAGGVGGAAGGAAGGLGGGLGGLGAAAGGLGALAGVAGSIVAEQTKKNEQQKLQQQIQQVIEQVKQNPTSF